MKDFLRKILGQRLINIYHLATAVVANFVYGFPSRKLKVIGVTGTDGKTTTVNLIAQVLKAGGRKVSFLSSINARIGEQEFDTGLHTTTPSPFLLQKLLKKMAAGGSEFAILEVTSHALDQYRVWGIKFETAVLTNITSEHLDYHKTYEKYLEAKTKLFKNAKYIVLNRDDRSFEYLIHNSPQSPLTLRGEVSPLKVRGGGEGLLSYGLTPKAQIWADDIKEDLHSTTFLAHIRGSTPSQPPSPRFGEAGPYQGGEMRGWLNLPGKFNVLNALAAICAGQIYQIPRGKIKAGLAKITLIPGRMEYIEGGQDFLAMVDFAHTPNALKNLLEFLRSKIVGKIILVFGSAGERDAQKRPEMGKVADELADLIVITREDNRSESVHKICNEIASGARHKNHDRDFCVILDRREAIKFALSKARKNDIVVVTGKGHEQSLNIDGREIPWDDRKVMREEIKKVVSSK